MRPTDEDYQGRTPAGIGTNILTLLLRTFDPSVIYPLINTFPRNQRYILGDHLERKALEAQELLLEAYYLPRQHKLSKLRQVNIGLEKPLVPTSC